MTSDAAKQNRKHVTRATNKALIIRAAERVFAQHGYKGATTIQIANEAGLPKANVHYYFKTKANIYRAVLTTILDDWIKHVSFGSDDDPETTLRDYVVEKMEYSRRDPEGSKIWASEIMSGAPIAEEFINDFLTTWMKGSKKTIKRWIKDKKIDPVDPEALLYMIWATTQHYADFERQIEILNGNRKLSDTQYKKRTDEVVNIILRCVGLSAQRAS